MATVAAARPRLARIWAIALTIDSGWREVADAALTFVQRFTHAQPAT
jgi:hypothetical protein